MHLNSGRINRPSLLSGGMQIKDAEPTSGRILADMEGLPEKKAPRVPGSSFLHNYPLRWVISAAVLAITAGIFFWDFSHDAPRVANGNSAALPAKALTIAPTSKPAIRPTAAPTDGAARIVNVPDESAVAPQAEIQPAQLAQPVAALPDAPKQATATATKPAATPAAKFARVAPPKAARHATASRPKAKTRATATSDQVTSDETLLVTLLGIIKEEDKAPDATKPQTLDDLIARLEVDQHQRTQSARVGSNQATERKPASTQSNIQALLRRCPSANTLQGVECRSTICAGLDATDPACPGS